jgi:hypothetical protein
MIIQLVHTHTSEPTLAACFHDAPNTLLGSSSNLHSLANEDETEVYRPNVFEHRLGKYCNFQ